MSIQRIAAWCLFLLCWCLPSRPQTLAGLEGGICYNTVYTNIANRVATIHKGDIDYYTAVLLEHSIRHRWYITVAPALCRKDYTLARTDSFTGIYEKHLNTYVQLPVMAGWRICQLKRVQASAEAGGYIGYWVAGHVQGLIPDVFSVTDRVNAQGQPYETFQLRSYSERYRFNPTSDRRWEAGAVLGIQTLFTTGSSSKLSLRIIYHVAFSSQEKQAGVNPASRYNQGCVVSIGYLISIHTQTTPHVIPAS